MRLALCFALALTASAGTLAAGSADGIQVVDPYVRAMPPGAKVTAAFMTLRNGGADTKLVKAESKAAKNVELHNHVDNDGVMEMRQVPAIELKANTETALQPGGLHIMMIGPTAALKEGDTVSLTLRFADGSSKTVEAPVKMPGAMPMMGQGHMHH